MAVYYQTGSRQWVERQPFITGLVMAERLT